MLFNTQEYLFFFLSIVLLYFLFKSQYRWVLLLIGSYFFYMNWNAEYAILIFTSTVITYACGNLIYRTDSKKKKKGLLVFSLVSNLGILFVFKYFNFFSENISWLMTTTGLGEGISGLDVLLPVGISFYTFQALSYSLDIYYGKISPEKNFGIYALYVSFFPQLVAGPIERSENLIPQLKAQHPFDYSRFRKGLMLIAFGLFKKMIIADRLGMFVDTVYNNPGDHEGYTLLLATVFFAFQIYCDFSGYSDIAIGSAQVLGIDLMKNFDRPYFAKTIGEFWSRWHISLSTWFRDYLYIPLGGNRRSVPRVYFNIMVTFLVSGLWHGASWNFVIWGGLHGIYLVLERITGLSGIDLRSVSFGRKLLHVLVVFILADFAWIFFRANTVQDSFYIISHLHLSNPEVLFDGTLYTLGLNFMEFWVAVVSIVVLLGIHWLQRGQSARDLLAEQPVLFRWSAYLLIALAVIVFGVYGSFQPSQFIYFQF